MLLIGKEGCSRCKEVKAVFSTLPYIEIPDIPVGLGDTICSITCWLGIIPCKGCRIRQNWCNKWFPYKRNQQRIDPKILDIKHKLHALGIKQYPVIVNDDVSKILQSF